MMFFGMKASGSRRTGRRRLVPRSRLYACDLFQELADVGGEEGDEAWRVDVAVLRDDLRRDARHDERRARIAWFPRLEREVLMRCHGHRAVVELQNRVSRHRGEKGGNVVLAFARREV